MHTHAFNHFQSPTMALNAQSSTEKFLEENSPEYRQHLATRNRTAKLLQNQNDIKTYKTIPKQYRPPTILMTVPCDTILKDEFESHFRKLFFQHLDKVIAYNTIALELEKARLQELITRTKKNRPPPHTLPPPLSLAQKLSTQRKPYLPQHMTIQRSPPHPLRMEAYAYHHRQLAKQQHLENGENTNYLQQASKGRQASIFCP